MRHVESTLQTHCVKWFRYQYPKRTLFSVPNGGQRNAVTGAILKAEGALAGVADLFLMHAAKGYNGLFIEMKNQDGKAATIASGISIKMHRRGLPIRCVPLV